MGERENGGGGGIKKKGVENGSSPRASRPKKNQKKKGRLQSFRGQGLEKTWDKRPSSWSEGEKKKTRRDVTGSCANGTEQIIINKKGGKSAQDLGSKSIPGS